VTAPALLLTPSRGLGGGIERYVETVEWAFADQGVEYRRVDLHHSGAAAHARMLSEAREQLRAITAPARLVVAHRSLLPVAWLLARGVDACGISVVCHGNDAWGTRGLVRGSVENRLMRRPGVRIVAVSNFTAGALAGDCRATVLPPGLSREWFDTLVKVSADTPTPDVGTHLATAFRLGQWRDKGLPELLAAVAALERDDIRVTICGSGEPPLELERLVRQHPRCTLRPGCTDWELAHELARADLFVLATRTRGGRASFGEGFGLVLLEAQVAGTPVIGPAYGGSRDAYLDRVSGIAPVNESAGELAKVLDQLLRDPARLADMSRRAAEWARECFSPERYAPQAVARLL
jgi:phosphatidylinositol alpha-1,6-mannosyltransferase